MKKNNVYSLSENKELNFNVSINDRKALSIIQEIPKENLDNFLISIAYNRYNCSEFSYHSS